MKGEGDDSPNNLSRSEEDTSEISLETAIGKPKFAIEINNK